MRFFLIFTPRVASRPEQKKQTPPQIGGQNISSTHENCTRFCASVLVLSTLRRPGGRSQADWWLGAGRAMSPQEGPESSAEPGGRVTFGILSALWIHKALYG